MSEYRLKVLLELRRRGVDESLRRLGSAVAAERVEGEELMRLLGEADPLRRLAIGAPLVSGIGTLQSGARYREHLRCRADYLRRRAEVQRARWLQVEAEVERAEVAFARARAERELLENHRRRWLEESRTLLKAAEEREVENWLAARYSVSAEPRGSRT